MNENYNEYHQLNTMCTFYTYKRQNKLQKTFTYTNIDTLQKARQFASRFIYKKPDTLRYEICHEIFEADIYVQKVWHFSLRDVFTKDPDTSQKARQFALRFICKNPDTLHYAIFIEFLKLEEGRGAFINEKKINLRYISVSKKQCTLRYIFTYKNPDILRYIFISKKQCTLWYVFISKIYRALLISINERTIRAIRSKNKFELFIENWSYSYDK